MNYHPLRHHFPDLENEGMLNPHDHDDHNAKISFRPAKAKPWKRVEKIVVWLLRLLMTACLIRIAFFSMPGRLACPATDGIITRYGEDQRYMTLEHANDHLWGNLSQHSVNGGLIWSAEGNLDGQETVGSISMFHQLHCLESFRKALQNSRAGKDIGVDWRDNGHWPHCFDYLRQTILCYADGTIERQAVEDGKLSKFITGADDTRTCGRSDLLYQLLQDKSAETEI